MNADDKGWDDMVLARARMIEGYAEARFEARSLRVARPYRTNTGNEWRHAEYATRMKVQHDLARAALRNLNALKTHAAIRCGVCGDCEPVAAYGGWCCAKALKAEVTL
jgi:glutamine synthetase adenylyltransferase